MEQHKQEHHREPTAIDVFAGAGGLSLGLHKAGWNVVFANDYDKWAVDTYRHNFPRTQTVLGDVRTIDFHQFRGAVSLVAGGPPCQPFSVAGNQLAHLDPRDMVPQFIRVVDEVQPLAFLMENVEGLVTRKHMDYFNWAINQLIGLKYSIHHRVLDTANYGVPQHRKRLIVVGVSQGFSFAFPEPTHGPRGRQPYVTATQALLDVPDDDPNVAKVVYAKAPIMRPSPYAGMLVNGQGRPINPNRPSQTIPASAGGYRTHIWDPDGVLLEYHNYLRSGGTPKDGIVAGVRRITTKESARLQSFPDDFVFLGSKSTRYKLIGNAVPPMFAEALGRCLLAALFGNQRGNGRETTATQLRLI